MSNLLKALTIWLLNSAFVAFVPTSMAAPVTYLFDFDVTESDCIGVNCASADPAIVASWPAVSQTLSGSLTYDPATAGTPGGGGTEYIHSPADANGIQLTFPDGTTTWSTNPSGSFTFRVIKRDAAGPSNNDVLRLLSGSDSPISIPGLTTDGNSFYLQFVEGSATSVLTDESLPSEINLIDWTKPGNSTFQAIDGDGNRWRMFGDILNLRVAPPPVTYLFDFDINATSRYLGIDPVIASLLPDPGPASGQFTYDPATNPVTGVANGTDYIHSPAGTNGIQITFANGVTWSTDPNRDFTAKVIDRASGSADVIKFSSGPDSPISVSELETDFMNVQFGDPLGDSLTDETLPPQIDLADWSSPNNIDLRATDSTGSEFRIFGTITNLGGDSDGDGIADDIDTMLNDSSDHFTDGPIAYDSGFSATMDGSTFGRIDDRGGNPVTIENVADNGVQVVVGTDTTTPAQLTLCTEMFQAEAEPGSEATLYCGSLEVIVTTGGISVGVGAIQVAIPTGSEVLLDEQGDDVSVKHIFGSGEVTMTLPGETIPILVLIPSDAAVMATADIESSGYIISNESDGGQPITVIVDGEETMYEPGDIFTSNDFDDDSVTNEVDLCPDTVIPESVPTKKLKPNRWALVNGDVNFDTVIKKGKTPKRSYAIHDTAGCSCEQIIEAQGLDKGHLKHGCSNGAMDNWVDLVNL